MDEYDTLAEELVSMFDDRDELSANIGEALRKAAATKQADNLVRDAVLRVFADPRYREQWSEGDILTRLLAALDPWYPYKGVTSASS